jgi:hypothetical protein
VHSNLLLKKQFSRNIATWAKAPIFDLAVCPFPHSTPSSTGESVEMRSKNGHSCFLVGAKAAKPNQTIKADRLNKEMPLESVSMVLGKLPCPSNHSSKKKFMFSHATAFWLPLCLAIHLDRSNTFSCSLHAPSTL